MPVPLLAEKAAAKVAVDRALKCPTVRPPLLHSADARLSFKAAKPAADVAAPPPPRVTWSLLLVLGALTEQAAAQALSATLTASDYNGYHISCFGAMDGSLTVNVSGGTAPYTYSWTTGATSATITDLAAGYYKVSVTDAANAEFIVDITLVEPLELKLSAEAYKYPSGKNISCWNCFNGSIAVDVDYGVAPYSYLWDDGPTTEDRSALGVGTYKVEVTDANGCQLASGGIYLEEPAREDWTMNGNAGTNPATQYIGTSDNKDLVFKTNAAEALRLEGDGDIRLQGNMGDEEGPLYRMGDGTLKRGDGGELPTLPPNRCRSLNAYPYWKTRGNAFEQLCLDQIPQLGTTAAYPLRIITNNQQRMHISAAGKVGIGTEPPAGNVQGYRLFVEDGIVCRDVLVKSGAWPDFVFDPGYTPMPLDQLRAYLFTERHLPGIPSAAEVAANDGVELGELQRRLLQVVEEQALYILQLEGRLKAVEQAIVSSSTTK